MLTPEKIKLINQTTGWGLDEEVTAPSSASIPMERNADNDPIMKALKDREEKNKSFLDKTVDVAKSVGGAIISSEKKFGESMAAAATNVLPENWTGVGQLKEAQAAKDQSIKTQLEGLKKARETGGDTKKWLKMISETTGTEIPTVEDLYPALKKTNLQVVGEAGGVLLDILSAGTYGTGVKGATSGKLYTSTMQKSAESMAAQKAAFDWANKTGASIAPEVIKKTTGQTLKTIGKETSKRTAVGAGTGYGYDVTSGLQEGETGLEAAKPGMATLAGAVVPSLIGVYKGTKALTKSTAPRFINSLIKPRLTEFSYGKDPGRTVAELGVMGNNLDDFAKNVTQKRQDIGAMLEGSYQAATDQGVKVDISDVTNVFDNAINEAKKAGKTNQGVVTALQNAKDAMLYDHDIVDGVITKVGNTPKNLSSLNPLEVFDTKSIVGHQTKFTGNPSDDKVVNATLKKVYGQIKEKLNAATKDVSPEIPDLNEKYADLLSAEIATINREAILQRSNIVPFFAKVGGAAGLAGLGTAAFTGVGLLPILAAAGAAGVESALASTAFKTRMAKWLGKTNPSIVAKFFTENPGIRDAIYRAIPKAADMLGDKN